MWNLNISSAIIRPKKKKFYVALSRPTVKCEKTGSFFFFFFLCQIWAKNLLKFVFNGLKKHLHDLYMRFDCIPPEFSPFRNFKKNIGKLNSLTVRKKKKKKKKKKSRPTEPIFKFWSGEGNITIFFFCLRMRLLYDFFFAFNLFLIIITTEVTQITKYYQSFGTLSWLISSKADNIDDYYIKLFSKRLIEWIDGDNASWSNFQAMLCIHHDH